MCIMCFVIWGLVVSERTWQACARLIPTRKRADMAGGREVGRAQPKPESITRMHRTTASTISSLLNCLMLSISSDTSLDGGHTQRIIHRHIDTQG